MKKILIILATITFIFALVISVVPEISQTNSSQNNNIAYAAPKCLEWEYLYHEGNNYPTTPECQVYYGGQWHWEGFENLCDFSDSDPCSVLLCQEQREECRIMPPE